MMDFNQDRKMLEDLRADCEKAEKGVRDWVAMKKKTIDQITSNHMNQINEGKETMNSLKKEELMKKDENQSLREKLESLKKELKTTQSKLVDYKEELHSLPAKMEDVKQEIISKEQEIESQAAIYEEALSEKQYRTQEMTKGVDYYKRNLGLEFSRVEDRLRMIFKHIDPSQPRKKFYFTIQVTEDDAYVVHDCVPEVPELDELVAELNETNDISAFVFTMRKAFKNLCN